METAEQTNPQIDGEPFFDAVLYPLHPHGTVTISPDIWAWVQRKAEQLYLNYYRKQDERISMSLVGYWHGIAYRGIIPFGYTVGSPQWWD